MTKYRLCLLGPTGKIAKVLRYWAQTDEGALVIARDKFAADAPLMIGFQLWDGSRNVANERKRALAILRDRNRARAARRTVRK
jgi:hypothetical protein